MEILFKDDEMFFYNEDGTLKAKYIASKSNDINLDNIKHLKDAKPLYQYRDRSGELYPVYYEHNDKFITNYLGYCLFDVYTNYIKDYTLTNLNLI